MTHQQQIAVLRATLEILGSVALGTGILFALLGETTQGACGVVGGVLLLSLVDR